MEPRGSLVRRAFSVPGYAVLLTQREDRQTVVKIRLQKLGRRNRAYFRIVVTDARVKRQGAYLEKLGQYDPIETDLAKQITVNTDRVKHWIGLGAQATEAVAHLLKKRGLNLHDQPTAKKEKKAKPAAAKK